MCCLAQVDGGGDCFWCEGRLLMFLCVLWILEGEGGCYTVRCVDCVGCVDPLYVLRGTAWG